MRFPTSLSLVKMTETPVGGLDEEDEEVESPATVAILMISVQLHSILVSLYTLICSDMYLIGYIYILVVGAEWL